MRRLIIAVCGLLLVAGIVGGVILSHSSSVSTVNGHVLGESVAGFVKIEAKLSKIDIDKCDDIGRPEKRELCDELVEVSEGRRAGINSTYRKIKILCSNSVAILWGKTRARCEDLCP